MKFGLLQPENLLLDTVANHLKLIDFGSAQEVETMRFSVASNASSNTTTSSSSSLAGTSESSVSPEFLSPEVISSGPVGTYTDMWGFGVLLYVSLRLVTCKIYFFILVPSASL